MKAMIRTGVVAALLAIASPGYTQTSATDTLVATHARRPAAAKTDVSDVTLVKSLPMSMYDFVKRHTADFTRKATH